MKKENGLVNWEYMENLLNDNVYQSSKKILKECIEIENTFDDIIKKIKQKKEDKNSIYDVISGIH